MPPRRRYPSATTADHNSDSDQELNDMPGGGGAAAASSSSPEPQADERLAAGAKQLAFLLTRFANTQESHSELESIRQRLEQGNLTVNEFFENATIMAATEKLLAVTNSFWEQLGIAWDTPLSCEITCCSVANIICFVGFGLVAIPAFIMSFGPISLDKSRELLQKTDSELLHLCAPRATNTSTDVQLSNITTVGELRSAVSTFAFPGIDAIATFMERSRSDYSLVDGALAADFLSLAHNVDWKISRTLPQNQTYSEACFEFHALVSQNEYPNHKRVKSGRFYKTIKTAYFSDCEVSKCVNETPATLGLAFAAFLDVFIQNLCDIAYKGNFSGCSSTYVPAPPLQWPDFKAKFNDYDSGYRTALWTLVGFTALFLVALSANLFRLKWRLSAQERGQTQEKAVHQGEIENTLRLWQQKQQAARAGDGSRVEVVGGDDNAVENQQQQTSGAATQQKPSL